MVKRLSVWLDQKSTGRAALLGLVVFLLFTTLVLPGQSSDAEEFSYQAGSPDLSLYYSPAELYAMAEAYGPEGRAAYVRARFTFDLAWPLVYTFFLATSISWIFRKIRPTGNAWQILNITPVLGAVFDYLENISAALVIQRYPQSTAVIDSLAPIFTLIKWAFVTSSFSILIAGVLIMIVRKLNPRKTI
jgi:hypothetical protein